MYRKPDSDSDSRSPTPQTPDEGSDELMTRALRKLRPKNSPRSDAFETFYQAGYQAALVASQPQPVRSNGLTGFGWGAVGGAILTAVILLSFAGIPPQPANHPAFDSGTTATVAQDIEESAAEESAAEKVEAPIELVSSPAFDLGPTLAMIGLLSNRGVLDEQQRAAITMDDLSRQRSWQPLWNPLRTSPAAPAEPTERVASSDHDRPRAASVWQLRKQIEEIAL